MSGALSHLFLKLFNMAVSATWLILAVFLLRLVFRKAPRWQICLLWALAALRLVCPVTIESFWSLVPSEETVPLDIARFQTPSIHSGIQAVDRAVNPVLEQRFTAGAGDSANPLQVIVPILAAVWLAGVVVLLLYAAVSCFRLKRRVAERVWSPEYGCYFCDAVDTPFLLGVFHPHIYLPSGLSEREIRCILEHEQAHLARRDHWWKPLGFLLLAVYWFHPLCWVSYWLFCRDIETACDQRVVKEMDVEDRKEYSRVLLACSAPGRLFAASPLAFGEVSVKGRIKSVLSYRKPALWIILAALAGTLAAAAFFSTSSGFTLPPDWLDWAENLQASDLARVEVVTMPQLPDQQYRELSRQEIEELAELLRRAKGHYVGEPEPTAGTSVAFYLTFTDSAGGGSHTVSTNGEFLRVDDIPCDPGWWRMPKFLRKVLHDPGLAWLQEFLNRWGEGDSPLPEDFYETHLFPMSMQAEWIKTEDRVVSFSDGQYADLWQMAGYPSPKEYRLPDGTVLLTEDDSCWLPGGITAVGTPSVDDLSDNARQKVVDWYRDRGKGYHLHTELEKAYRRLLDCQEREEEYESARLSQEVVNTAGSDRVLWMAATVSLPDEAGRQREYRWGAAFDRDTGEWIDPWELFSVPREEALRRIFTVSQGHEPTQAQLDGVEDDSLIFTSEGLELFVSGENTYYAVDIAGLRDILHDWAVPGSPEG